MNRAHYKSVSVNVFFGVAALFQIGIHWSFGQSIEDVARSWEDRRSQIDTLRCVTVGEETFAPGAFDNIIGLDMVDLPKGTKPPLPDKEHKSPYRYAVQYDFRKHRARVEMTHACFVPKTLTFHPGDSIRAFDGDFNRGLEPKDVSIAPDAVQFFADGPDFFGYGLPEIPVLLACGYAPPQQHTRKEPYIMSSLPTDKLSIAGTAKLKEIPIVVVRSAAQFGNSDNYDEYWTDPAAKYRVVKWFRYMGKELKMTVDLTYDGDGKEEKPSTLAASDFLEGGKLEQSYTVKVKEWQVNIPVQKPDFVLNPDSKMVLFETSGDKN